MDLLNDPPSPFLEFFDCKFPCLKTSMTWKFSMSPPLANYNSLYTILSGVSITLNKLLILEGMRDNIDFLSDQINQMIIIFIILLIVVGYASSSTMSSVTHRGEMNSPSITRRTASFPSI
ncbi:hypothetical protein L6452_27978 [Arctium lappa]|uniref:Uncharacterized protein n=1 Tax=Arctium lappa TaxID=4217 RepID=A0ACB8ZXG2_ARCLA|nr:hypothetical protein L6452_27978 [Arctium lappa]